MNLFNWKLKEEELKKQVEEYHTLDWKTSYRKVSAIMVWVTIVISLGIALFADGIGDVSGNEILLEMVFFWIPISFFIWKGKKWAFIAAIIVWSFGKFYYMFNGGSVAGQLIWWAIYMSAFLGAIQVENARSKLSQSPKSSEPRRPAEESPKDKGFASKFCGKCGSGLDADSKFCTNCGNKIATNT